MNEQEILTQLRKAAEEIEIPETLKPEQIEKQLQEQKAKQQQENQHLEPNNSMAQTWKYGGSAGTGSMQRNLYNSDPFR